jgi:hypothetical protein
VVSCREWICSTGDGPGFDGTTFAVLNPSLFLSLLSFSLTMSDPILEKATDTMATDASSTVKFNVGGRLYEVSRSLVEKFPSTMLARMVSDMWQKDPEATLFIGRSGERFEYSLDYMRADKVWLPLNIPKEAILDDLAFYGFENVDPSKIHGGSSNQAAARHLIKCKEEHEKVLATCIANTEAAEKTCRENKTTSKLEKLAYACFVRFSQGKSLEMSISKIEYVNEELHSSVETAVVNHVEFQDLLAKYGLALVNAGQYFGNTDYCLTLKEKEDTIN